MNFKSQINFDNSIIHTFKIDDIELVCDLCDKKIINKDFFYIGNFKFHLCGEECLNKFPSILSYVDKFNYSRVDKPLIWHCDNCNLFMGSGYDWYCNDKINIDICKHCYNENNYIKKFNDRMIIIEGGMCLNLSSPLENNFEVPTEIQCEITDERNEKFTRLYDSIVQCDIKNSLRYWTMFTDFKEMRDIHSKTCLIINCEKGSKHEIASLLVDNHGKTGINLVFNSFEKYLNEYDMWKTSKNEYPTFSEYVRISRNLSLYYG